MNGDRFLVDSVILIDHFNGVDAATAFLGAAVDRIHLSAITRAEVLVGFDAATEPAAKLLLDRFPLLVIDRDAADLAARLRRQGRWKLPDALQAAVALLHGLKLATRNTKDFDPTRDEFVVVPYTLSGSG